MGATDEDTVASEEEEEGRIMSDRDLDNTLDSAEGRKDYNTADKKVVENNLVVVGVYREPVAEAKDNSDIDDLPAVLRIHSNTHPFLFPSHLHLLPSRVQSRYHSKSKDDYYNSQYFSLSPNQLPYLDLIHQRRVNRFSSEAILVEERLILSLHSRD